jgi:hypothetical protein
MKSPLEKEKRQLAGKALSNGLSRNIASRCPFTGLSRSVLADLCVPNANNDFRLPVKSIRLKKDPEVKRAARLVDFQSLMQYLRTFEQ